MLEAKGVSYKAGEAELLREVDLEAPPGRVLSIVGPNGAGKSTLLSILSGDLRPTAGAVFLDGQPMAKMDAKQIALRRAVLPQQTVLQFAFRARDVVLMGRNPHLNGGWPSRQDFQIAEAALDATEMQPFALRQYPGLSGGEQSRITLARVLTQQAPVLMLDEPTSSLDIRHQEMVMRLARSLAREGACVLVIIHDLNLAAAYSDCIALMKTGRIVARGATRDVMSAEVLSDVFDCPLHVIDDACGSLLVVPRRH